MSNLNKYVLKIGLEVHVQLKTDSKLFCSCLNRYGHPPNTLICPVCTGHPGVLPVLNRESIIKAVMTGLICNCEISKSSRFDRKSYFYPDMPKNYQITQYRYPICLGGNINISGKSMHGDLVAKKSIRLIRIHLEEDVAKINYLNDSVCVDYNRAGIPLIEIVSEPDISSADEAYLYLVTLRKLMRYSNISDCDMEKGQMRCDVNLSLNDIKNKKSGTRLEIKNLNSFKSVYRSIQFEVDRQSKILESGGKLKQVTLGWNDDLSETYLMRTKEEAGEYRYFPEPDILPIILSENYIEEIKTNIVESPGAKKSRFIEEYDLPEYDAQILTSNRELSEYFDKSAQFVSNYKMLANWIITNLLKELNQRKLEISSVNLSPENMSKLINLISSGKINMNIAKDIFDKILETDQDPDVLVKREDKFTKIEDEREMRELILEVMNNNKKQVDQFIGGNKSVFQYLVGQVMKASHGRISPKNIIKILDIELSSRTGK